MNWVRFQQEGQSVWGTVHEGTIHVCVGSPLDDGHHCGPHCSLERLPVDETPLLPPCTPTKIVCVGRNYMDHIREMGHAPEQKEPLFFLKPPSSLLAPGGAIRLPALSQRVDHEGELGVVIKRRCRGLKPGSDIRPYILGYTCLNDVTARDLQNTDGQWTRAKGFDTFCPVGPWVVEEPEGSPDSKQPWDGLDVVTEVNGVRRQNGNTRDFIFSLPTIFYAITAVMTLEPGDLLATGTPSGVGPLQAGDRVRVTIGGVGGLENTVAAS